MAQDPFGEIPLFRELHRLLTSSEGPVNLEIARQVADALNQGAPTGTDPALARRFSDAVHTAEAVLSGFTRLPLDEPVREEATDRREWISATLDAWGWLLGHLAQRFSDQVARFSSDRGDDVNPMGAVMGQIAPLLLGMQAGTLVGHLAGESLGRYDPPIPREDDGHLFFVSSNVEAVARDYDLDLDNFVGWLALHDVAQHLVVAAHPWLARYQRSLFIELIDSLEIDASDLERRLADLQTKGPEALQEGMQGPEMLPLVPTERHRRAKDRVAAFTAALTGYANLACDAVDETILGDAARIDEGMRRRASSPSESLSMLQALLGITFDRAWEQSGQTFCAAVLELRDIASLNRLWAAPDNLPTLEEIRDPFSWMERVLSEDK